MYTHDNTKMNYEQLRTAVQKAWDEVPEELLKSLVGEMKDRCQAVIDAEGKYTRCYYVVELSDFVCKLYDGLDV